MLKPVWFLAVEQFGGIAEVSEKLTLRELRSN
jgi:hypothetical protein